MSFLENSFNFLDDLTGRAVNLAGGVMDLLDYSDEYNGEGESGNGMTTRQNPEVDTTEIDRTNPYGLPSNKTMFIYGGAALGVVLLFLAVRK